MRPRRGKKKKRAQKTAAALERKSAERPMRKAVPVSALDVPMPTTLQSRDPHGPASRMAQLYEKAKGTGTYKPTFEEKNADVLRYSRKKGPQPRPREASRTQPSACNNKKRRKC
jgi:hypothetical protein